MERGSFLTLPGLTPPHSPHTLTPLTPPSFTQFSRLTISKSEMGTGEDGKDDDGSAQPWWKRGQDKGPAKVKRHSARDLGRLLLSRGQVRRGCCWVGQRL